MKGSSRIEYHDLRHEALSGHLPTLVGRRDVLARLDRVVRRRASNNVIAVGKSGIGKTTLVHGWMKRLARSAAYDESLLIQLGNASIQMLEDAGFEEQFTEAAKQLSQCMLFIDDMGKDVHYSATLMRAVERSLTPLLQRRDVHVLLTLESDEYTWLEREFPAFVRQFETIMLKEQLPHEYRLILQQTLPRLNATHRILVPDSAIKEIVEMAQRYPALGNMPRSGIRLLDESLALCALSGSPVLKSEEIAEVIETKIGVPKRRLAQNEMRELENLERHLSQKIVGQERAIANISSTLLRAQLGLRNPNRPLGSFLMLGPSGVGKTETAKGVAEIVFGRTESFQRFDMSEFQQDHTVQRLIGAPAGYVGHEEGGALTNALRRDPYSLILLDEIEKAHPKVFDIFLQVLDDGRLTSGQNETVDARNAVVMATSNVAVAEILSAMQSGVDIHDETFLKHTVIPILGRTFRLEFINRFDKILIFEPLSQKSLVRIAELEIRKLEKRLSKHQVRFDIDPVTIAEHVRHIADPRFGARPIKRFVEDTCESLVLESLMPSKQSI